MVLRTTTKFTYPNGEYRRFYGCSRWPECNSAHGAHPDGSPMGVPANKETKQARIQAHDAFDGYWRSKGLSRKQAYHLLQDITGLPPKDAHIASFDKEQCECVVYSIEALKADRWPDDFTEEAKQKSRIIRTLLGETDGLLEQKTT